MNSDTEKNKLTKEIEKLKSENKDLNILVDRYKRSEKLNTILLNIAKKLNSTNSLKSILKYIHLEINKLLDANNFYLALYNSETGLYTFPYFSDQEEYLENEKEAYDLSGTLTDFIRQEKKSMMIDERKHEELAKSYSVKYVGPLSPVWLGAPVFKKDNCIGVIAIQTYSDEIKYSKDDIAVLNFVASILSNYFERISKREDLEKEVKKRTAELSDTNDKLQSDIIERTRNEKINQALYNISEAVNNTSDLTELYRTIHKIINKLIPADNFYIALLTNNNTTIEFPYFIDKYETFAPPIKLGEGITSYLLKTGKSLNLKKDNIKKLIETGKIKLVGEISAAWIGVPLKIKNIVIGAMVIQDYDSQKSIGIKEQKVLNFISEQVAIAIDRKQNELKISEFVEDLTESENQLRELVASKDKFFSIIAHDLKSPFQSLLGTAELLDSDIENLSLEELKLFSSNIKKGTKNLYNLVENLLEWARIQTGKIELLPKIIDTYELINEVILQVKGPAQIKNIKIKPIIKNKSKLFADRIISETILRNILTNAIKFSFKGENIIISVNDKNGMIEFSIKDNGVGIEKSDIEKLFRIDIAHSTIGTNSEKGTGLGLPLCKELVEISGGKIWVESEIDKGTTFYFTLPALNRN